MNNSEIDDIIREQVVNYQKQMWLINHDLCRSKFEIYEEMQNCMNELSNAVEKVKDTLDFNKKINKNKKLCRIVLKKRKNIVTYWCYH